MLGTSSTSDSLKISATKMNFILEKLKLQHNRDSTKNNYHTVWRLFNQFLIKLDISWEDRVFMFMAHLVNIGCKSTTVKSYLSGIRVVLYDDNVEINEDGILLKAITHACKLQNDQLTPCLPIRIDLLEMLLFEIDRLFLDQGYLRALYKALFSIAYYGLFRIDELAHSDHSVRACDAHIAENKEKILLILYTSKTHGLESQPQKIKISSAKHEMKFKKRHFCPFILMKNYLKLRGDYSSLDELFFVFHGGIPVEQHFVRNTLTKLITRLGFDHRIYTFQAMRAGRATDLHKWGFSVEQIKIIGRWHLNAIYKYLKF